MGQQTNNKIRRRGNGGKKPGQIARHRLGLARLEAVVGAGRPAGGHPMLARTSW